MGDFRDIMSGIDHLDETGLADPDRLAISGASYGGYMTAWSITQTTRFRAAGVGCAITGLVSFVGTPDARPRFENYPGADPRDYVRLSPMEYVERVRTPSLNPARRQGSTRASESGAGVLLGAAASRQTASEVPPSA